MVYRFIFRQFKSGGGVNQAYSRLSTTHVDITDYKLDSVVYAGVQFKSDKLGVSVMYL